MNSCKECHQTYRETESVTRGLCFLCQLRNRMKNPTLEDPMVKAMGITDVNDPKFKEYVERAKGVGQRMQNKFEEENPDCGNKKKDKQ